MNAVAVEAEVTPEDLARMPDEKDYELVDGRLVERKMSALSSWVAAEIAFLIRAYLADHPIGLIWGADNGYQCFPDDPKKVRRADVSFVKRERLPADWWTQGYLRIAPDLAVEVLSPNDLAVDVEMKVSEYLKAGVSLIWVVNPDSRSVRVHRGNGCCAWLNVDDEISGEDVLAGFRCPVVALFPPATAGS